MRGFPYNHLWNMWSFDAQGIIWWEFGLYLGRDPLDVFHMAWAGIGKACSQPNTKPLLDLFNFASWKYFQLYYNQMTSLSALKDQMAAGSYQRTMGRRDTVTIINLLWITKKRCTYNLILARFNWRGNDLAVKEVFEKSLIFFAPRRSFLASWAGPCQCLFAANSIKNPPWQPPRNSNK